MAEMEKQAHHKLQMPPVIKVRSEELEVLSEDYELQGLSDSKWVFTDVTYGLSERVRHLVQNSVRFL
jgi:Mitochondrial 28S ribosomal protein S22.